MPEYLLPRTLWGESASTGPYTPKDGYTCLHSVRSCLQVPAYTLQKMVCNAFPTKKGIRGGAYACVYLLINIFFLRVATAACPSRRLCHYMTQYYIPKTGEVQVRRCCNHHEKCLRVIVSVAWQISVRLETSRPLQYCRLMESFQTWRRGAENEGEYLSTWKGLRGTCVPDFVWNLSLAF